MSRPLFKGDISAPLSAEEIKDFMGRFSVDLDLPARERQRYATQMGLPANSSEKAVAQAFLSQYVNIANETITGRMQMRKLMRDKDEKFNVTFGASPGINAAAGVYFPHNDQILVGKDLLADPKEATNTLLHECTHDTQNANEDSVLHTLVELETQSFSFQLANEINGSKKSTRYDLFYKDCQKKWLRIAKNPAQTPRGLPKFEPVPGLSAKEMTEARTRYANQMASLETQSAIMLDFLEDKKSPIPQQHAMETFHERRTAITSILLDPSKTDAEKMHARKELIALFGGVSFGSNKYYADRDLKGIVWDPMDGRIDKNLVKRMQADNPFVTDGHFDKVREIEAIQMKKKKEWKNLNEVIDGLDLLSQNNLPKENPFENIEEPSSGVVPTNETNAMAQTNQTLESSSQNITQEKTDDMLIINQQNASQRIG